MKPSSIAVLGAGVIGLATGIRLLNECPNVSVTMIADLTGSETTSQGSGGLWMPYTLGILRVAVNCYFAVTTLVGGDTSQ